MEPETLLMNKVKKGDLEALDSIVDKYKTRIYNHFLLLCGSGARAEELSRKVFLEVFQESQSYQERGKFSTYLFLVAHRLSQELGDAQGEGGGVPGDAEKGDRTAGVLAELFTVSKSDREILILREIQRFNYEEIKEIRGCSVDEVRSALNRARKEFTRKISHLLKEK